MKKLTLNSNEPAYTVHIKDIVYVNEEFDGPKEIEIEVEKSFVDEESEGDMEQRHSLIEDCIYEDLQQAYDEEVVSFTIVTIGHKA